MRKSDIILVMISLLLIIISIINVVFVTPLTTFSIIILLLDLLTSIYWICRRNLISIVMGAATLSQLFFLPAIFNVNFINIPYETESSIKVATYNVHNFSHNKDINNKESIISVLEKEDIDIVCFQEYTEINGIEDSVFRKDFEKIYKYNIVQDEDMPNTPRLAIFSKFPIQNENKLLFKNGINSAMYADIEINGKIVRVINCHLQTTGVSQNNKYGEKTMLVYAYKNSKIRKQQSKYLSNLIDSNQYPIILGGDFNDLPFSYSYRVINRKLSDGYKQCGIGKATTYNSGFKKLLRIDYIFNSKELNCTRYYTPNYTFSDHNIVISVLEYKN